MNLQVPAALLLSALILSPVQAFQFQHDPASGTLTVQDGTSNVLSLRYGDQLAPGVDAKYTRSAYIHPLWSLDGQVMTDDFPSDHPHHHGVFWAWPAVQARGNETQNWHPHDPPLRHHFVRWIEKAADKTSATITMENHWLLDEKELVAKERATLRVHGISQNSRAIDVELVIEAVGGPLTLQGSPQDNKGYGGFCFRAAPSFKGATIMTASGVVDKDIVNKRHRWIDLSNSEAGLAIFTHQDHPDNPPRWMARNSYAGFMNVSWPGLEPTTLQPGKPVVLQYRLYIHRGKLTAESIKAAYVAYVYAASSR